MHAWNSARGASLFRAASMAGAVCAGAMLAGCDDTERDIVRDPDPVVDPVPVDPVTVPPAPIDGEIQTGVDGAGEERTDVDIEINRDESSRDSADLRQERREERRGRIREVLENVDVNVDAEQTDVQIGDGEIDVDAQ